MLSALKFDWIFWYLLVIPLDAAWLLKTWMRRDIFYDNNLRKEIHIARGRVLTLQIGQHLITIKWIHHTVGSWVGVEAKVWKFGKIPTIDESKPPDGSMGRHGSWKNHALSACWCMTTLLDAYSRLVICRIALRGSKKYERDVWFLFFNASMSTHWATRGVSLTRKPLRIIGIQIWTERVVSRGIGGVQILLATELGKSLKKLFKS